jgi:hypothetical protein
MMLTGLIISLAIIMIMLSGIRWITAGGDSGKIGKAKEDIITSLIGLFIAVFAYYFLYTINPDLTNLTLKTPEGIKSQTCCVVDTVDGQPVYGYGEEGSPLCKSVEPDILKCVGAGPAGSPCTSGDQKAGIDGTPLASPCICGDSVAEAGSFCCADESGNPIIQSAKCEPSALCTQDPSCTIYTTGDQCRNDLCGVAAKYGPDNNFKTSGCEWVKDKCWVKQPAFHAGYAVEQKTPDCPDGFTDVSNTSPNACVHNGYLEYIAEYCGRVGNKDNVIQCSSDIESDGMCDCDGGGLGD